jgi:hypothetical protein
LAGTRICRDDLPDQLVGSVAGRQEAPTIPGRASAPWSGLSLQTRPSSRLLQDHLGTKRQVVAS